MINLAYPAKAIPLCTSMPPVHEMIDLSTIMSFKQTILVLPDGAVPNWIRAVQATHLLGQTLELFDNPIEDRSDFYAAFQRLDTGLQNAITIILNEATKEWICCCEAIAMLMRLVLVRQHLP